MKLDRRHRANLAELRQDGSLSSHEFAEKAHSRESGRLRQLRLLEKADPAHRRGAGAIRRRVAKIAHACGAAGVGMTGAPANGRPRAAAGIAILMLLAAHGRAMADDAPTMPPQAAARQAPLYATSVEMDRMGRVLAEVEINGRGPYRFIVDTGANRSALSPLVAAELGLVAIGTSSLVVHGVTGSALLPIVDVASLRVGDIVLEHIRMPVLPGDVLADADGILGVEGLQNARIDVNFAQDSVTVRPSTGRRAPSEYLVVPARIERGGLMMVNGRIGRLPVRVIIDTGAERTLGNAPLRDALQGHLSAGGRVEDAVVIGATPGTQDGVSFLAPMIRIGEARLRDLPVTFGDLHVFEIWDLEDEPALLIGMDLIGSLDRFVIDFRQRQFHLKLRPSGEIAIRHCRRPGCGSRVAQ